MKNRYHFLKALFCKHKETTRKTVYEGSFVSSHIIHPIDKSKIPVMKQEIVVRTTCNHCGKFSDDHGYNSKPFEDVDVDTLRRKDFISRMSREKKIKMYIEPYSLKCGDDVSRLLSDLSLLSDEDINSMCHEIAETGGLR